MLSERLQTTLNPRGPRELCIRKNPLQCFLNTFGIKLHRSKPCAIFSSGYRQHCIKNPVQFCLNTLGKTLHSCKPYAIFPVRLQTTLHKKNVPFNVSIAALAILVLCNVVPQAPSNTVHEKFRQCKQCRLNNTGHSVYIGIYQVLHAKKNIKLSFLYYGNRLKLRLKQQLGILPTSRHSPVQN